MKVKRLELIAKFDIGLFFFLLLIALLGRFGFKASQEITDWLTPGLSWIASVSCIYLANWDVVLGHHRKAWIMIGLGEFIYGFADLWYSIFEYADVFSDVLSFFDFFYLASYLFFIWGFIGLSLKFHENSKNTIKNFVRCFTGSFLIGLLLYFVFYRIALFQFFFMPSWYFWFNFSYVVLDIFLIMWAALSIDLVLNCARKMKGVWLLLLLSMVIFLVSDIGFVVLFNEYLNSMGVTWMDIGWMIPHIMIALAALHYGRHVQEMDISCKYS